MTQIHSQDAPFHPDVNKLDASKKEQKDDRDATFALDTDDPARVENRGGLEVVIDGDTNNTDPITQSEYSSDPGFRQNSNNLADQIADADTDIDASATRDEDVSKSVEADNASGIMDELEAEMDDRIEEEDKERG